MKEDDNNWPLPDRVGRQELEVIIGSEHTSFTCTKLGSVLQVQQSKDPDGLKTFYYLVQVRKEAWENKSERMVVASKGEATIMSICLIYFTNA